jgi:hypothetical protein
MRNQIGQNAVKQLDVIGPEICGAPEEQFGDPARRLGAAPGIAMSDDLIEAGDQRRGDCHQTHSKPPHRQVLGNLGRLGEGRVRFENLLPKPVKSRLPGFAGLAGQGENRYISRNLWFSYDSVLRVGPFPDPLFFIT